jgi:hypothetical protein
MQENVHRPTFDLSWSWEDVSLLREGLIAAGKPDSLSFRIFARLPGHSTMGPEAQLYDLPNAEFKIVISDPDLADQCSDNLVEPISPEVNHYDESQTRGGAVEFQIPDSDMITIVLPAHKVSQSKSECTIVTYLQFNDPDDQNEWLNAETVGAIVNQESRNATMEITTALFMSELATGYGGWDGQDETMMPQEIVINARFVTTDLTNTDTSLMVTDPFAITIRSNGKTSADFCDFSSIYVVEEQHYPLYYFISADGHYR